MPGESDVTCILGETHVYSTTPRGGAKGEKVIVVGIPNNSWTMILGIEKLNGNCQSQSRRTNPNKDDLPQTRYLTFPHSSSPTLVNNSVNRSWTS